MKEYDMEKLELAIEYISRMADGKDPLTDQVINNEILENPKIIRCFHFTREVLQEVMTNHGVIGKRQAMRKVDFPLDVLKQFEYHQDQSIMYVLRQFAEPVENTNVNTSLKDYMCDESKWKIYM